jgi:hypothetical protein
MKALSFRQPWAELILQGRKTLDLRTYLTHYRGPLAIHASKTIEREACLRYGLDPGQLATGGVVGVVELIEVIPLAKVEYERRRAEHLTARPFEMGLYGWILRNPQPLPEIVPIPGRMRLFNVEFSLGQTDVAKADGQQSLPGLKVKETIVSPDYQQEIRPKISLNPIERSPEEIVKIERALEALREAFDPDDLEDWETSRKTLWATDAFVDSQRTPL